MSAISNKAKSFKQYIGSKISAHLSAKRSSSNQGSAKISSSKRGSVNSHKNEFQQVDTNITQTGREQQISDFLQSSGIGQRLSKRTTPQNSSRKIQQKQNPIIQDSLEQIPIEEDHPQAGSNNNVGQQKEKQPQEENPNQQPQKKHPNSPVENQQVQQDCLQKLKQIELSNYFPKWQWYQKQSRLGKAGIIGIIFLIIASITGLIVWLVTRCWNDCQPQIPQGLIVYQGQQFVMIQETYSKENHDHRIILAQNKKTQVIDRTTEGVVQALWKTTDQLKWVFSIRLMSIIESFGNTQKHQQAYKQWLEQYNANPRKIIDQLLSMTKQKMSKTGTKKYGQKIPDNIILQSIVQQLLIDVEYDPIQQRFFASTFTPNTLEILDNQKDRTFYKKDNLKSEPAIDKKNKKLDVQNNKTENETQPLTKQELLAKVMKQSIWYIKRVVARNIQVIKVQGDKLKEYQKTIIDENKQLQAWQKLLVEDCKSIEMLRFRCKMDAAIKLIPDLTFEKIQDSGSNYIISENLEMVFKEVPTQLTGESSNDNSTN